MSQRPPRVALVVGAGDYIGATIAKRFTAGAPRCSSRSSQFKERSNT